MPTRNWSSRAKENGAEQFTYPPDKLQPNQHIVRILNTKGQFVYAAQLPGSEEEVMVELSAKFRHTIWLRRGGYALIDRSSHADRSNRLDGEIIGIVLERKLWTAMPYWPKEFDTSTKYDFTDENPNRQDDSDSE